MSQTVATFGELQRFKTKSAKRVMSKKMGVDFYTPAALTVKRHFSNLQTSSDNLFTFFAQVVDFKGECFCANVPMKVNRSEKVNISLVELAPQNIKEPQ